MRANTAYLAKYLPEGKGSEKTCRKYIHHTLSRSLAGLKIIKETEGRARNFKLSAFLPDRGQH
jgi:hypothetical protein